MGKKWKITDDELLKLVNDDIEAAERFFDANILPQMIVRYQLFNGDKEYYQAKFPRLDRKSRWVSSDIEDAVNWIMPSLIEVFLGSNKIVTAVGRTAEDKPEAMEALIQFQAMSQNRGFLWISQWILDSLKAGLGSIKTFWERRYEMVDEESIIDAGAFIAMDPKEIKEALDQGDGNYKIVRHYKKRVLNQPRIINCKPGEHIWSEWIDEDGIRPFECHRRYMTADELRRKAMDKVYDKAAVERAIAAGGADGVRCSSLDELDRAIRAVNQDNQSDILATTSNPTSDGARNLFVVYECFARYDIDGDGMTENVIVSKIGNELIQKNFNKESRPPFSTLAPFPNDYQRAGQAVADLLQDHQDLQTALIRQTISAISQNNERPMAIDGKQITAIGDFNLGRALIRFNLDQGKRIGDVMQYAPEAPMSPENFTFLEFLEGRKESRIGMTRYNQGLDANSLNKTATGISRIMDASQKRVRLITRTLAETGFKDLMLFLVELNHRYIDQAESIRITGKYLDIRPDDISGTYDIEISAGVGVTDPQSTIDQMLLMLKEIYPLLAPLGIAGPAQFFTAARVLIEQLGYKDIPAWLVDPSAALAPGGMVPPAVPGAPPMAGPPSGPMMPRGQPGQPPVDPRVMMALMTMMQGGQPGAQSRV